MDTKICFVIPGWVTKQTGGAELKFDISLLPTDRLKVDPLRYSYPEEWHFYWQPFVTHQRRSYAKSFSQTEY